MTSTERRHDIDWLRVIAIGLLLIYHISIVFQPWGVFIGFIQSSETSSTLWTPMAMLNIWRIPLLFFVSGIGVCFALRRRDWKALLYDRTKRILVPLIFGTFVIVPVHVFIFQIYYNKETAYSPSVGHLWFLANIIIYVLQIIGFAFLDKSYDYKFFNYFRKLLKYPFMIYLFILPFVLEAVLLNPDIYSLFVGTGHGFVLGMFCFFFGFIFVAIGDQFWKSVEKMKLASLTIALTLYLIRLNIYELKSPNYLTAIESINWIFAVFGFAYKYLNQPSRLLNYLSESVYPVYIIHMAVLFTVSYFILPLDFPLEINFAMIVLISFTGCFTVFEILKRINMIRPLLGMTGKYKN